jgi:hypothetical protein
VSNPLERFAFVDAVIAAEVLHVTPERVLDWVAEGKLKPFGGKASNPFFRSADIAALAQQVGVGAEETPKRVKSGTARVQQRLTADSRWSDVGEDDIREWARRADGARRQAAKTAIATALERLEMVRSALEEVEG